MGCAFRILTGLRGRENQLQILKAEGGGPFLDARPEEACFGTHHAKNDSGNVNIIAGGHIDGKHNPHT